MPEIEITEAQYEYLQALREDIQQEVAGPYAHVRTVDAVQYLIDNHEGDIDATVAAAGDAGPAAGAVDGDGGVAESTASADDPSDADAGGDGGGDDSGAGDEAGEGATDGGGAAPMAAAGGAADDDGMLSAMMQLLDTHDERWQKVEGDTGYDVELPDGGTETVNTKDDVRALLYQHYE